MADFATGLSISVRVGAVSVIVGYAGKASTTKGSTVSVEIVTITVHTSEPTRHSLLVSEKK